MTTSHHKLNLSANINNHVFGVKSYPIFARTPNSAKYVGAMEDSNNFKKYTDLLVTLNNTQR